jgi:hypothetical protein
MGRSDGRVTGAQQIVGSGPSSDRWTLAIMGDGFQAGAGMAQFRTDAAALAAHLLATAPYSTLTPAINVVRVDVESVGTGVREPPACGGNGTRFRTYFEGSLCGDQRIKRFLTVKKPLVLEAAALHVPEWDQIIVIVNTTQYGGGALGGVATCTKDPKSWQVAMHELGHNLGLADEYEEIAGGYPAAWSAPEPNMSKGYSPVKWSGLVNPATPLPTQVNYTCGRQGPTMAGTPGLHGAFEGGKRYTCDIFRPSATCKMRVVTDDFCQVCHDHIRGLLSTYLPTT